MRRSGAMVDTIKIGVGISTTQEQIDNLILYMNTWIIAKETREINPQTFIFTSQIYDSRRLDLSVLVPHKSNHQDGGARVLRRTRFMLKLTEGLTACGIDLIAKPIDMQALP